MACRASALAKLAGRLSSSRLFSAAAAEECSTEINTGAWKWGIRKQVWDLLEAEGVAASARHRFPSFTGVDIAAERLSKLRAFRAAECISVNTDTPQRPVRLLTLKDMKTLLVPCFTTSLYSMLDPLGMSDDEIIEASNKADSRMLGKPLGFDADFKVDLIVVGSVAVDPRTGARLGKGEGLADLEYAVLRHLKLVDDSTLLVTTVHDKQLVDDIPEEKMLEYDVPVDIICTPTQTIYPKSKPPKPTGICWEKMSPDVLGQRKVLSDIRKRIKEETGKAVKLAPSPQRLPRSARKNNIGPAIFVTELNPSITEAELKDHLQHLGVAAEEVVVFKTASWKSVARVTIPTRNDLERSINAINNTELKLKGWCVKARQDSLFPADSK